MSYTFEPTRASRRPIVVSAHPGGRFPGVELPPTWFTPAPSETAIPIPSPAVDKNDHAAIFEAVRQMGAAIRDAALPVFQAGLHPMLIGGDHSLAIGTLAALTQQFGRAGVIWVDAHADFNTDQTSPSGNPHGMPLSAACGLGDERLTGVFGSFVDPRDVVLLAAREIDPGERDLLDAHGVWVVTVAEIRAMGLPALLEAIARRIGQIPVHLSFDFDSIDISYFRATGTPSPEGLMPDEAEALVRGIAHRLPVVSSDWVEFDPRHNDAAVNGRLAARLNRAFAEALAGRVNESQTPLSA